MLASYPGVPRAGGETVLGMPEYEASVSECGATDAHMYLNISSVVPQVQVVLCPQSPPTVLHTTLHLLHDVIQMGNQRGESENEWSIKVV